MIYVPTVESAQQLAKDLDLILDNGGFQVKGWLSNETLEENLRKEDSSSVLGVFGRRIKQEVSRYCSGQRHGQFFKVRIPEFCSKQENPSELKFTAL